MFTKTLSIKSMIHFSETESWSFTISFHATGLFLYPLKDHIFQGVSKPLAWNVSIHKAFSFKTSKLCISVKTNNNHQQKQLSEVLSKKAVLKNFAIFRGKQLCWSPFLIKLQAFRPAALLKKDSKIGVFLWNLQSS